MVSLLMFRATYGPVLGPGQLSDHLLLPEGSPAPEESRMLSPFPPDPNAAGRAETGMVPAPEAELGQVWKEP